MKNRGFEGPFNAQKIKFRVWIDKNGAFHLDTHLEKGEFRGGNSFNNSKVKSAAEIFEKLADCCLDDVEWYSSDYNIISADDIDQAHSEISQKWLRLTSLPAKTTGEAFFVFDETIRALDLVALTGGPGDSAWIAEYASLCKKLSKKLLKKIKQGDLQEVAQVVASWVIAEPQKIESSPRVNEILMASRQEAIKELGACSRQFLLKAYGGKGDARSFIYQVTKTAPFIDLYKVGSQGLLKVPTAIFEFLKEEHSEWIALDSDLSEATIEALDALYRPGEHSQPYSKLETAYQAARVL